MIPIAIIYYILAQFNPTCHQIYYSKKASLLFNKQFITRYINLSRSYSAQPDILNQNIIDGVANILAKNAYSKNAMSYSRLLKLQYQQLRTDAYYDTPTAYHANEDLLPQFKQRDENIIKHLEEKYNYLVKIASNKNRSRSWSLKELVIKLSDYYYSAIKAGVFHSYNHEIFMTQVNFLLMSRHIHFYPLNLVAKINPILDQHLDDQVHLHSLKEFRSYFLSVFNRYNPNQTL